MNPLTDKSALSAHRLRILELIKENAIFRNEIRVAREAAEITATLVVKQFEETERILRKFQDANAQRKAVLDSATQIAIVATAIDGIITVFNTGAENLLGYRAKEIIGVAKPDIFHDPEELKKAHPKTHGLLTTADRRCRCLFGICPFRKNRAAGMDMGKQGR